MAKKDAKKSEAVKNERKKHGKGREGALIKKEEKIQPIKEKDEWDTLLYPHLAEKSMNMIELENKLVFIVKRDANKNEIKEALEKGFNIKVLRVNTEITRTGEKRAYVKLHTDSSAIDIATRMGMI